MRNTGDDAMVVVVQTSEVEDRPDIFCLDAAAVCEERDGFE